MQFRYHIYRTIYFLEQGSVKGVKKEVKSSSDLFLLFADETDDDIDALLRCLLYTSPSPRDNV